MTSRSKLCTLILFLLSGVFVLFPSIVKADYAYKKAITIDHTKVSATLTNFPTLVSISNDNDLKNHVTSPNGYDLVFKDGSGTQLNHELEKWDGSTGTLVAWVRIPTLSSTTDTVIYMWYGDSGVTTSQENKTGVWDSNFKGVWHLPNGTTLNVNDSTSNGNNGTNNGATATTGKIDGGASFNGTNNYISVPNSSSLQPSGDFTITAWINPTRTGNWQGVVFKSYTTSVYRFAFALSDVDSTHYRLAAYSSSYSWQYANASNTYGSMVHIAFVYNASTGRIAFYTNATSQGSGGYSITAESQSMGFGQWVGSYWFKGILDEIHISSGQRSINWIMTEYNNQGSPATFYTVGSETVMIDTTPPVVTTFVIPSLYNNLTVPITTFTATDNVGVTGYLVNELPSTPSVNDPNWSSTAQTQYTFSSDGSKPLYAWAKDAAGNISSSRSATVSITLGRRIYLFDALHRLIQVIYEDGRRVTYTYDAAGNRITVTNE